MAVPTYTTDLVDITLNEALGTWVETGTWTTGTAPALEPDVFIQGSNSIAKYWTSGGGGGTASGAIFDAGSALTIPSPGAFFMWIYLQCPNNIDSEVNGGLRAIMGDSGTAFNGWTLGGKDTLPMGGWVCFPVDPAVTRQYVVGTPTEDSTRQWFGFGYLQTATAKGGVVSDALRYGRGRLSCEFGSVADGLATFSGAGTYDSNSTRRWGLLTPTDSGYLMQGLFQMGTTTNAVDFRDSNVSIVIPNTKRVISTFNSIEILNTSSRVDWTTVNITVLGTTALGNFTVTDNADVNFLSCTFAGMGIFTLLANTEILNSTFRNCGAITIPGGKLNGTSVLTPVITANTSAVTWNVATDPDGFLDNMTFSKGTNAHHAIEFGTSSPLTMTLRGIDFTGFSASQNNDASIFHIKRTSGAETVTINLINCSSDVSFATSYRTDGALVSIVQNPKTFSVTAKNLDTGAVIENARVMVPVTSGANFPYQASVTITGSGTTATVTHTAHGRATNDNILIAGANEDEYNGAYTITKIDANTYTYTTPGTVTASPATGTITATMVLLNGLTNASGVITDSRTYSAAQPVSGWVRKATGSPLYRQAPVADTVSSTNGLSVTVFLQPDE